MDVLVPEELKSNARVQTLKSCLAPEYIAKSISGQNHLLIAVVANTTDGKSRVRFAWRHERKPKKMLFMTEEAELSGLLDTLCDSSLNFFSDFIEPIVRATDNKQFAKMH